MPCLRHEDKTLGSVLCGLLITATVLSTANFRAYGAMKIPTDALGTKTIKLEFEISKASSGMNRITPVLCQVRVRGLESE